MYFDCLYLVNIDIELFYMFQTYTLIWYVLVVHCEHPIHQIWNSSAAISVVKKFFSQLAGDMLKCFVPGKYLQSNNRVSPIDVRRKSSRESIQGGRNSISGAKKLSLQNRTSITYNDEKSKRLLSNKSPRNATYKYNKRDSESLVKPCKLLNATNIVTISSSVEKSPYPTPLSTSANKKVSSSSKNDYLNCKNSSYKKSKHNGTVNQPSNDQILNLDALINSFHETAIKQKEQNSDKTSKKSIMSINRFPNIQHQPATFLNQEKLEITESDFISEEVKPERLRKNEHDESYNSGFNFSNEDLIPPNGSVLLHKKKSLQNETCPEQSRTSISNDDAHTSAEASDLRPSKDKSQELNLGSLINCFDNARFENFANKPKKSIMTVNRFPNIKHQSVVIEENMKHNDTRKNHQNIHYTELKASTSKGIQQNTFSSSTLEVNQCQNNGPEAGKEYNAPVITTNANTLTAESGSSFIHDQKRQHTLSIATSDEKPQNFNEFTSIEISMMSHLSCNSDKNSNPSCIDPKPSSSKIQECIENGFFIIPEIIITEIPCEEISSHSISSGNKYNTDSIQSLNTSSLVHESRPGSSHQLEDYPVGCQRYQGILPVPDDTRKLKNYAPARQTNDIIIESNASKPEKSYKWCQEVANLKEAYHNRRNSVPVASITNNTIELQQDLAQKKRTKEEPISLVHHRKEPNSRQQQLQLLSALRENGAFEINRMESSYDPIVNCMDFNRCFVDANREHIYFQKMPDFFVFGMSGTD